MAYQVEGQNQVRFHSPINFHIKKRIAILIKKINISPISNKLTSRLNSTQEINCPLAIKLPWRSTKGG